jgi:hypothetical protein
VWVCVWGWGVGGGRHPAGSGAITCAIGESGPDMKRAQAAPGLVVWGGAVILSCKRQ